MNNNWEQISSVDALFGIASADDKKNKGWNEAEFFKVGEQVVVKFMGNAQKFGYPVSRDTAVDFGCGAGRLLRFSSKYFKKVIGIDIAAGMIELSKKYNSEISNLEYYHNTNPDLRFIPDSSVDLVYTFHVLQHIPKEKVRIAFLKEFQRVLKKDGLAVFHVPIFIPLRNRLQPKRRLYDFLKMFGVSPEFLMNSWGLYPIHMKSLSKQQIFNLFAGKFELLELIEHVHNNGQISGTFYYKKN